VVNDVRQIEIYTAVLEPRAFEVELALEKLKSHKSHGSDQIPAELRHGVEQFAMRSINLLFLFGIRRNCLRSGRSRPFYLSIRSAINQCVVIIGANHICHIRSKFYPTSWCQV